MPQFFGFCVLVLAGIAVTHRTPFDLPEAEAELVAGYHTEYSGMKFGMFFVGEYVGIVLISSLTVTLFFGGWQPPFHIDWIPFLGEIPFIWFALKACVFMAGFILLRASLPRPRYDQMMAAAGKSAAARPHQPVGDRAHSCCGALPEPDRMNAFLSVLRGIWSQFRSIGMVFMHTFRPRDVQMYPEEMPVPVPPRYRGRIVLTRDPDGDERCVACNLCAVACPVDCISLQKAERPEDGRWYPEFFRINFSRCIFCGLCEEACPTTAIQLTPDFEMGEYDRQNLVYEKEHLLIIGAGQVPGLQLLPRRRHVDHRQGQGRSAERRTAGRLQESAAMSR